jgi:Ca2+-binding RTX toxin-like protein
MLLDMRSTTSVTDVAFHHVTFELTSAYTGTIAIGNGQGVGTIAVHDGDDEGSAGLTFQNVTMASNDHLSPASTAFIYTKIASVEGARMVIDGVSLTGATTGGTGIGAQWNMSPPDNDTSAAVDIVHSETSGGGNFYVSAFDSVLVDDNTFDGQGVALNGVKNATVTGNTFQNIGETYTGNGTQHRGLMIEDAWGTDGVSNVTVTGNTFDNISVEDGAISFQRFTGGDETATVTRLNDVHIHDNTFTGLGGGVPEIYLDPESFGEGAVLPADFDGEQVIIGTGGADAIVDDTTGTNAIFASDGNDTVTGGVGDDSIDGGTGIDAALYSGTATITASDDGWSVTTTAEEGTDTLSAIEQVDGAGDGKVLLVGNGGYETIQAAINDASDGDTVLIADETYNEALSIVGKAITLQAAGDHVVIEAPEGTNAITLSGDFEAGDVSINGLEIVGAAALPNQGIGVYVTEGANVGKLTVDDASIHGAGSYGVFVDGENNDPLPAVATVQITNSTFADNGYNTAPGSAHIKLFGFGGTALIQNVTIEGAPDPTPQDNRPDYGIELTGTPNEFLGDGTIPMGSVTLDNVTMTGLMHKMGLAIYNYATIADLAVDGVDLSGVGTNWGPVLNIDGILGDVDASGFDIVLPAGSITTELQGDKVGQTQSDPVQVITGTDAEDRLIGKGGDDHLIGGAGNDELYGHDKPDGDQIADTGNDLLDGGTGADGMAGGAGNDTYVVDDAGDTVTELLDEGTDTVESSIDYTLGDNVENLTLTGTGDLAGTGNGLNNTIVGNTGANTLNGQSGNDALHGGDGDDQLFGDAGNDALYGDAGQDILAGSNGDDVLDGGTAADTMIGGADNDTYVVDDGEDNIIESANQGYDTVKSSLSYTLGNNLEKLILLGGGDLDGTGNGLDNTLIGNAGNNILDGDVGADTMKGGAGNDTFHVDDAGDVVVECFDQGTDIVYSTVSYSLNGQHVEDLTLVGGFANINGTGNGLANILTGNESNNTLDGAAGADTMKGGLGDDTYYIDNAGDMAVELKNQGMDLVNSSVSYSLLGQHVENLTLTGTDDIDATGNTLANILTGNEGNNVLDGASGADKMYGGDGDDTYYVANSGDLVTELEDQGSDTVISSLDYTLTDHVENLTLRGSALNGTGNAEANILIGTSGKNVLDGGADADTMKGGDDDDTYYVDDVGDVAVEAGNEGTDLVNSSVSYNLGGQHVENLTLTGIDDIDATGNTLANILTGNEGNNVLDGASGADKMYGGDGDDTYHVANSGDQVTELENNGSDTVISWLDYTLTDYVENLTLTGSALNGTGNGEANILIGTSGNNVLDGGADADTMKGGVGNDTYYVDNVGDVAVELKNEGTDLVNSSVSYSLYGQHVENLTLAGADDIDATGNSLANILTGNEGNNALDGASGADKMYGGDGDDTYYVANSGDLVTELDGQGSDTVISWLDYTLTDHVENLTLRGSALNGTGNAEANILIGTSGKNVLDGGADADTMKGGDGDDIYYVDNIGDLAVETSGGGTDLVNSSVSYSLDGQHVENLTLTGIDDIDATGNSLTNTLTGNEGNNVLDGASGADKMYGGDGDDTYYVGNSGDLVTELENQGSDTAISSVNYTLTDHVENLTLTESATDGTGNGLDNTIVGNAMDNNLDGADGADQLFGDAGNDILTGGNGNNELHGGADSDTLLGGTNDDLLDGGADADIMIGGIGNDTYVLDHSGDLVSEGSNQGIDTVEASITYTLGNNVENLTLTGDGTLSATGNTLDNTITGNESSNTLTGGAGHDTFVFNTALNSSTNVDQITDFSSGDLFNLSHSVFSDISWSAPQSVLTDAEFHVGAAADTEEQRIIYDDTNGTLSYDADGSGVGAAVQFATVTAGTDLTHDHFLIV